MEMIPQYAFAGDYTVEAIQKGVQEVGKYDAGEISFLFCCGGDLSHVVHRRLVCDSYNGCELWEILHYAGGNHESDEEGPKG